MLLAEFKGLSAQAGVAAIWRGHGFQYHPFEVAQGVWNLYRYDALQPDGSLPMFLENEADTTRFQGEAVLILGPPAAVRTFNAARCEEVSYFSRAVTSRRNRSTSLVSTALRRSSLWMARRAVSH